jgi:P pilus assembly chaperone PapD
MRRAIIGSALFCGLFYTTPASAQLAVDRLWVDFGSGAPDRSDVVIRNESKDRYYISVTASEITDPGTPTEKRIEISDPDKLGILVTPNRLVVDPGGVRSIRVVSLNNALKTDRVYRIKIEPQVGEIEAGAAATGGNRGLTIKVLAAYDVLVTARPKDSKPNLTVTREASDIIIRNTGNTNTLLLDGEACPAGKGDAAGSAESKCDEIGSKRIYPGNEWAIPIKTPDTKILFKERRSIDGTPKDLTL